jgi:hypothetical protein
VRLKIDIENLNLGMNLTGVLFSHLLQDYRQGILLSTSVFVIVERYQDS